MKKKDTLTRLKKLFAVKMKWDINTKEGYNEFCKHYNPFPSIPRTKPKCRFCGGPTRALNNNGIIGPGYNEWNYACEHCGRIQ